MKNKNDIVALNDSQILRWICELNGIENLDEEVEKIQCEIKKIKKQEKTLENKNKIKELYQNLYSLQYQKDYFCMIMNSDKDYDTANKGFKINQYTYKRLLGTNGGIKKSTITYIGENIYSEIKKRMDCGRDKSKPIVPAKLEAYQSLICSGSIPVTTPRILVVNDCNVKFNEDIIKISDENDGEPLLTYEDNCEIEYCDSDGYGFMSPAYSKIVCKDLFGEEYSNQTISGINTRYAWTKGMLFTFDFVDFAKKINHETYMVLDAWGEWRDVRDYDVILTVSMVKLWDSYNDLEHFIKCCEENHYQFSVAKTTPFELENVRNANYQFLQDYELTDEEIKDLCTPTIAEIKDALGNDYRKAIVFLKGMYLNEENIEEIENDIIKALMIDKRMINDSFIVNKIYGMIHKRIQMAAKGSIKLNGNFSIISGDLYSLAQSIFGLPVTGLLKAGEVYHKYWVNKNVDEILCFRAPMTCHNNIRKRKVVHSDQMDYWYQYITTALILNSWDTTCDATNGADKDSDTYFTTNNPILLKNTKNLRTIECLQRKAEKILPLETDMVKANKLAFGDEIGATTNRITSMIEVRSQFAKNSKEYEVLSYRIMCGQHFQQNSIDKAKGIISKPMPNYWYDRSVCKVENDDSDEVKKEKEFNLRIVADKKPYFMKYVYPDIMRNYNRYIKNINKKCMRELEISLDELLLKKELTDEDQQFIEYIEKLNPVGNNPCVVNKICWLIENEFKNFRNNQSKKLKFDYSIMKSNVEYSKNDYLKIQQIYDSYLDELKMYSALTKEKRNDKEELELHRLFMLGKFKKECYEICSNEKELCDILLDLCYSTSKSKQFVWDICGDVIIDNLLNSNDNSIYYPYKVDVGEFEFAGEQFIMCKKQYAEEEDDLL